MKQNLSLYEEYLHPRLMDLSGFDRDVFEHLSSEGPLPPKKISAVIFDDESCGSKRIGKITKSLTRLERVDLVYHFGRPRAYVSVENIVNLLLNEGPCFFDGITSRLGVRAKYDFTQGLGKVLSKISSDGIIEKFKDGGRANKTIFYLPFVPEHTELVKLKGIRHAKEVYEILADGESKNSRDIYKVLNVKNHRSIPPALRKLESKVDWLGSVQIRGDPYEFYWFRKDKVSPETIESLENMKKNRILKRIMSTIEEPKTASEIIEECGLSEGIVYKFLERLKRRDKCRKVKANPNRYSSSTPSVWFATTDGQKFNEFNRLKAKFKSASLKYGEKLFDYLGRFPVFTIDGIISDLNLSLGTVTGLLRRLGRYGLVANQPSIGWYSPMVAEHKGLKLNDTLNIYRTVKNGIKGFTINFENGQYVATPEKSEKPMDPKYLIKIANSNNILIKDGMRPYFPGKFSWSLYGLHSQIIFNLRRVVR